MGRGGSVSTPTGPSDKTVGVVRVETLAGDPTGLFINDAVHGTGMGQENYLVSADVPGATARGGEQHYQDKGVAVWTSCAGGRPVPYLTTARVAI